MTSTALIDFPPGLAALPAVSRDEAPATTGPDAWACPAWTRLVVGCLAAEDFEGARRLLADAARGAGRRQSLREATTVDQLRLRVELYEGRLDVVRASAQNAIATATWRGEAGSGTVATAHAVLAVVAVEHGSVEEAERHARSARRLGVFADGLPAADLVMLAEALSFDLLSRPDLGVQALRPFLDDPTDWEDAILAGPRIVAVACHTAVAAGQPALALRTIRSGEAIARDHGEPPALLAALAQAKSHLWDDPGLAEDGARCLSSSPRRLAAAIAYEDAAHALERSGQMKRAVVLAREALARYGECGAAVASQRVRQWLRAHGVNLIPGQRRGRPNFGWEALSDAETRVVTLVAEGLTNRQIGERLFLSRFTVDTHLRHVFTKLGLTSRVGLTRAYLDHVVEANGDANRRFA